MTGQALILTNYGIKPFEQSKEAKYVPEKYRKKGEMGI